LIGSNLATHLIAKGWEVYGVARKPESSIPGVRPIAADLLEPEALRTSLAGIDPTHVFMTTWVRRRISRRTARWCGTHSPPSIGPRASGTSPSSPG